MVVPVMLNICTGFWSWSRTKAGPERLYPEPVFRFKQIKDSCFDQSTAGRTYGVIRSAIFVMPHKNNYNKSIFLVHICFHLSKISKYVKCFIDLM